MRFRVCIRPLLAWLSLSIFFVAGEEEGIPKETVRDGYRDIEIDIDIDGHRNRNPDDALEEALKLEPPIAASIESGDTEGSEWWLEHESLLRSAWNQWDNRIQTQNHDGGGGGDTDTLGDSLIDPDLRLAMDRTKKAPTPEHEAIVHRAWDEVLWSSTAAANDDSNNASGGTRHHRVYRHPGFLTGEGIRRLRSHLDALSASGIPTRRPNAMNRNGLLLDPSVPGGVSGDPSLQAFVELLARDYLRPLGRSFFPEFAGDPADDSKHYAFTIKYGTENEDEDEHGPGMTATATATNASIATDWYLKEHSDASIYTLNINLNLPGEGYSGSSLYFNNENKKRKPQRAIAAAAATAAEETATYCEIGFEPGTALLHRGMTKHGAKPLEGGKRNNLVIWLHGTDGYVRIAPYPKAERLSLEDRWTVLKDIDTETTFATEIVFEL